MEEWSALPKYEWHLIELTASVHASQRNAKKLLHGHHSAEKLACGEQVGHLPTPHLLGVLITRSE
ncbi:MAG TPA: hypothetical protein DG048_21190 [Pseudoalteromonas sp.]|nr:hypothetical protein [Pseudoalteromonas sp.]